MVGSCQFCSKSVSKTNSLHHLLSCPSRKEVFEKTSQKLVNEWFYIQAESSPYWLDVLIPRQWKLKNLDQILRDVWLECCGHLSHFHIGDIRYERYEQEDWLIEGEEASPGMEISLNNVLDVDTPFSHIYDYGSTTRIQLRILDALRFPVKKQIYICARNQPPAFKCANCKNPASEICPSCDVYYCGKCARLKVTSDDCEHVFLPLVNSPRTGVCGYDGMQSERSTTSWSDSW